MRDGDSLITLQMKGLNLSVCVYSYQYITVDKAVFLPHPPVLENIPAC